MILKRNSIDVWDVISYVLSLVVLVFVVRLLGLAGALIDLLILWIYYEVCVYARDLAEDVEDMSEEFERRIKDLEERSGR